MKYHQKFGRQENLITYFSHNATQSVQKIQQKNEQKSYSSLP